MADVVFNIAKGRVNEYVRRVSANDPSTAVLSLVLLKTAEADATLIDYDSLSALLAGSNTECDFTNYARQTYDDTAMSGEPQVDDTADDQESSLPQKTISSAGGASNNTLAKAILCYDGLGTNVDANMIPLCAYDASETTNGNDLVIAAGIVFRAS